MRVQWSDESPHPRVGQTQRDLLDGRTADCEGKQLMGLLEGCAVGTSWSSWFCLNTKDPRTLCKDFEKGPWDTSVVFQNTLSLLWIYNHICGVVEGSAGRMVCHWFLGSLSNIGSWLTAWHLGSACGSTRLIFLHVLTHGDYPIATVKSKVFPSSISPTRIRLVTMSVSISWRGCIWSPNWRPSMGAQRIPIDYWVDVTDQKPLVEVKLFGTLWCASGGLLHISSSMRSRRLPRL